MNKNRMIILVLVLLATMIAGVSSAAAGSDSVGLTIRNRTDKVVWVSLLSSDGSSVYWLEAPAGETVKYFIPKDVYTHTSVACGKTATGTLELEQQTKLAFTRCGQTPSYAGERSIEKVHFYDSPDRRDFNYRFD
jgi:hypothetical protein